MVSWEQVRQLALALPEAVEQDHHGRPSFRVAGRIFATLWDENHINVMLDEPGILTAVQNGSDACEELWWGCAPCAWICVGPTGHGCRAARRRLGAEAPKRLP